MVLFGDDGIPTIFRYTVYVFSGKRQAKSQMEYPCGVSELEVATGDRPPPILAKQVSTVAS